MARLNRVLTEVENVIAAGTLAAAVLISIVAILLRAIFGVFLFWSEEAVIYLVIYSTFFGAIVTLRHNEHVNVDIIAVFLNKTGKKVMAIIALVVTLVYLGGIGYYAWLLIFEPFSRATVTPALKLPLWTVELSIAVGFTLMFLRALEMLFRTWKYGPQEVSSDGILLEEAEAAGLDLEATRASIVSAEGEPLKGAAPREEKRSEKDTDEPDDDDTENGRSAR